MANTIKITQSTINDRLDTLFKSDAGKSRVCEKHEKRMKRISPQDKDKMGEPWILSVNGEAITLVARSTCGHSKEPCFDRFAADLAIKGDDGEWIETTKDYKRTVVTIEEIAKIAAVKAA